MASRKSRPPAKRRLGSSNNISQASQKIPEYNLIRDAKILIVEDNPLNSKLFSDLLSAHGCRDLTSVGDVLDACVFLSKHDEAVIILDIQLPHSTGFDVLDFINENSIRAKVIICSAYLFSIDNMAVIGRYGVAGIQTKPIGVSNFLQMIEDTIKSGRYVCAQHNSKAVNAVEQNAKRSLNSAKLMLRQEIASIALNMSHKAFSKEIRTILNIIDNIEKIENDAEIKKSKGLAVVWGYAKSIFAKSMTDGASEATKQIVDKILNP